MRGIFELTNACITRLTQDATHLSSRMTVIYIEKTSASEWLSFSANGTASTLLVQYAFVILISNAILSFKIVRVRLYRITKSVCINSYLCARFTPRLKPILGIRMGTKLIKWFSVLALDTTFHSRLTEHVCGSLNISDVQSVFHDALIKDSTNLISPVPKNRLLVN